MMAGRIREKIIISFGFLFADRSVVSLVRPSKVLFCRVPHHLGAKAWRGKNWSTPSVFLFLFPRETRGATSGSHYIFWSFESLPQLRHELNVWNQSAERINRRRSFVSALKHKQKGQIEQLDNSGCAMGIHDSWIRSLSYLPLDSVSTWRERKWATCWTVHQERIEFIQQKRKRPFVICAYRTQRIFVVPSCSDGNSTVYLFIVRFCWFLSILFWLVHTRTCWAAISSGSLSFAIHFLCMCQWLEITGSFFLSCFLW